MKLDKRKLNKIITNLKKDGGIAIYPLLKLTAEEEKYLKDNSINVTRIFKEVSGVYTVFKQPMIKLEMINYRKVK